MTARPLTLAVTGATGFVGQATVDAAVAAGCVVRALTRRAQPARDGVTWVAGALDTPAALHDLARGCDAVLHIAGAVNVPTRADFAAANIGGTQGMIDAAAAAGVRRFVHISSLAARHPHLSNYGWSKAEAERVVSGTDLDVVIVRPPAVYGPHDRDMFELFRMARRGFMLLPPAGRTSIIHVADLAALIVMLAASDVEQPADRTAMYEPSDGTPLGLSHRELGAAIGRAVGRPALITVSAPRPLLLVAAQADRLVRGDRAKLTPDRASYMAHPDWVSTPTQQPAASLWTPHWSPDPGLAMTADWYRNAGWL